MKHIAYDRLPLAFTFHIAIALFLYIGLAEPLHAEEPFSPKALANQLQDQPGSRKSFAMVADIRPVFSVESAGIVRESTVADHSHTLWDQYKWYIMCTFLFFMALLVLVAVLFVQKHKRRSIEKVLSERLQFEEILTDLLKRFINIPPEQVDQGIDEAIRMVCEHLDLDLGILWQWSMTEPRFLKMTHLYRPLGGPPTPIRMAAEDMFPWAFREVMAGRIVTVNTDEAPAEAVRDQEAWRYYGIKSTSAFPLSPGGGPLVGVLGFNTMREKRLWQKDLVKGLQLVGEIFANALKRKLSDQALRDSEERLSLASASAGAGLWILDFSTGQFWVTAKALELFSLAPDYSLSLDNFLELVHPEDRERVSRTVHRASQSNDDVRIEYRIILADNSIRWIFSRGRGQLDPSGEARRLMGVSLDITLRKQMEEKIKTAAREWQTTFDSIPDMVMILDREHRVVQANAAIRSFLNLPLERILGNHCHTLMHGENYPINACLFPKISEIKGHEERDIYDDLKQKWFHVSVDPVFDDAGETIRVIHTVKDITESKWVEAQTFGARKEMMRRDRLLHMGELTASLAHELNQPLTSILGNAQAALRFIDSGKLNIGELKDILKDIANDDKRAGDIIRSLKSMVKPEGGEKILVSLNDVVRDGVYIFHSEAIIRNINVESLFIDPLPKVNIDMVQIQQVVTNLIMNAMESMPDETKNKKIIIRTQASEGNKVRVAVSDCGPGIKEEDLSKIFEPFFTTKRSGLGMGLSLSRTIIEAHGGNIWVENNPNKGVTFYFDLPAEVRSGD